MPESSEKRRQRRVARKLEGFCTTCGKRKPIPGRVQCDHCHGYHRKYHAKKVASGLCSSCPKKARQGGAYCEQCLIRAREYRNKLRDELFQAYGGYRCKCCGETHPEFLQIDHIHNDGAEHRKQVGIGTAFYYWLKKNGYPPGFQVLCANCNYAKAHYGYCPHHRDDKDVQNHYPRRKVQGATR